MHFIRRTCHKPLSLVVDPIPLEWVAVTCLLTLWWAVPTLLYLQNWHASNALGANTNVACLINTSISTGYYLLFTPQPNYYLSNSLHLLAC